MCIVTSSGMMRSWVVLLFVPLAGCVEPSTPLSPDEQTCWYGLCTELVRDGIWISPGVSEAHGASVVGGTWWSAHGPAMTFDGQTLSWLDDTGVASLDMDMGTFGFRPFDHQVELSRATLALMDGGLRLGLGSEQGYERPWPTHSASHGIYDWYRWDGSWVPAAPDEARWVEVRDDGDVDLLFHDGSVVVPLFHDSTWPRADVDQHGVAWTRHNFEGNEGSRAGVIVHATDGRAAQVVGFSDLPVNSIKTGDRAVAWTTHMAALGGYDGRFGNMTWVDLDGRVLLDLPNWRGRLFHVDAQNLMDARGIHRADDGYDEFAGAVLAVTDGHVLRVDEERRIWIAKLVEVLPTP